jgi:serine phosphatase RsbU (regulator of sigma subunit)
LLLYTDGVTEATTAERAKMFGVERLAATLSALPEAESLENWGDRIRAAVDQFTGKDALADDITLLLLRRLPLAEPTP